MEDKKKVPRLRFPEFTDDWAQCKLRELAVFSKGVGYSKSDLKESGTPIILYGRLYTKYETIIHNVDTFADAKSGSIYSEGGEVIVPASGETAEDISIASVVEKPGVLLGGDLNIIHPKGDIDPTFLAISISNGTPHIDMARRAQGKSVVHLHNDDLSQIELRYPSLAEQQKIGHYFSNLDNLITLHQRQLDNLKKLKKGCLKKMFPKDGETEPELRFPGFTDDWEQHKLKDITSKIGSGKTPLGGEKAYKPNGIPLIRSQNVNENRVDLSDVVFIDDETDKSMSNSRVLRNDVLLNITGASIGRSAVYEHAAMANVNQHVCIIRPVAGYNSKFVQLQLSSDAGQKLIASSQAGGAREGLNFYQIGMMKFMFPNPEEQDKISSFFSELDSLISLHQRKLDELNQFKKGMLQQMFV